MRRAFVLATAERYVALVLNLLTVAIVARVLTPSEFGVSVIGLSALSIFELLREFGANTYIVQLAELNMERVRTAFTAVFAFTVALALFLYFGASWLAEFYETPGLTEFMRVSLVSFLLAPFVTPIYALLRREMKFAELAIINVTTLVINAIATVVLAVMGFSFMSIAWANAVSGSVGLLLGLYFWRDLSVFRPTLKEWRSVAGFARYDLVGTVAQQLRDSLPALILGRTLSIDAIGVYQRATRICDLPRKLLFGGLAAVVLPALSEHNRGGGSLKQGFLCGLSLLSALQWPCLIVVVLLAHPIVLVLLGDQWGQAVPLVQIMAAALMLGINAALSYSTLVVAGAVRQAAGIYLVVLAVAAVLLLLLAPYGVEAAAASLLVTVPLETVLSMMLIRERLDLRWVEIMLAVRKSAQVTLATAAGPLLVIMLDGFAVDLPVALGLVAGALAAAGWIWALRATEHPLWGEIVGGYAKAKVSPGLVSLVRRINALRGAGAALDEGR